METETTEELIDRCFKEIGYLEEKHKGILNFKAFSPGAWKDVDMIEKLYKKIMGELSQ